MEIVLAVIVVIQALLLIYQAQRKKNRYDGVLLITTSEEGKLFTLELYSDPEILENKKEIVLKRTETSK
jgi:hypothetical protein